MSPDLVSVSHQSFPLVPTLASAGPMRAREQAVTIHNGSVLTNQEPGVRVNNEQWRADSQWEHLRECYVGTSSYRMLLPH